MEKSREGFYDRVLEPAPLVALGDRNILLLLRFSLDDGSHSVVTSGLEALCQFLQSRADEICLDRLVSWRYPDADTRVPEFPVPENDVQDLATLKDHEVAQLDSIAAAVRTDIVLRLRFILSEIPPSMAGVVAALEIMTRMARHSSTTALNIACTPGLLDVIVQNFIPLEVNRANREISEGQAYGVPIVAAIKLCRVLVSYAGKPAASRLHNLQILRSIMSYALEESSPMGMLLVIESLRLWKSLMEQKIGLDSVDGARLSLLSRLQLLLSNHDLESSSELACEYATALIDVASQENSLKASITVLLAKWSTQLAKMDAPTWSQSKLVAVTLQSLDDDSACKCAWIQNSNVFANFCSNSNLLSDSSASSITREPSSLPSLGVLMSDGKSLQPCVGHTSPMPFFATLLNIFAEKSRKSEISEFLEKPEIQRYIDRLTSEPWNLVNSWYTRTELYFVTGIIRGSIIADEKIANSRKFLILATKLLPALPADAARSIIEILRHILRHATSRNVTHLESLAESMESLKIEKSAGNFNKLADFAPIYEKFVAKTGNWWENGFPRDWIYLPVVAFWEEDKKPPKKSIPGAETTISRAKTIEQQLLLEFSVPEVVEELSPSLRFSRLSLIFLCDTIFLEEDVRRLLVIALRRFFARFYRKLDIHRQLPGLNSFTDLFASLCENFCANSYGDFAFSMMILAPCAQRQDPHYRKLLWSEHAAALRYIKVREEDSLIPVEEFFYPLETDSSLVEAYITALVRGVVREIWSPLIWKIAVHHSALFLKGNGKLAGIMRRKIALLPDRKLAEILTNYTDRR